MRRALHRRNAAVILGGIIIFSAVYAAAAALNVSGGSLAAGNDTVAACDTDGVGTSYAVSFSVTSLGYVVDSVTVNGIADACFDQDFSVTLTGASGSLGTRASADVPSSSFGGSANARTLTVDFTTASPRVLSANVTGISVSISD